MLRNYRIVFQVVWAVFTPTSKQCTNPVPSHPLQHLVVSSFLIVATLIGVSLMAGDVEQLCVLICISSLGKCLFLSFAHFPVGLLFFTVHFERYLDSVDVSFVYVSSQIFLPSQ